MEKIIFVGMHNKPMKKPLCSSTKSGKLVDKIAFGFNHLKTNLYNVDYYPKTEDEKYTLACDWIRRIDVFPNDIIILLGAEVHENFVFEHPGKIIKIPHPSSQRSHEQMSEYVLNARNKIETLLNHPPPTNKE